MANLHIALIHGWNSDPSAWDNIVPLLRKKGHHVITPKLPPLGSMEKRTAALVKALKDEFGSKKPINLIGHSMGGLNARQVASRKDKYQLNVITVTTLASPHRGSFLATLGNTVTLGAVSSAVASYNFISDNIIDLVDTPAGGVMLSAQGASKFNELTPDHKLVLYMSWAAIRDPSIDDDICVGVNSAKWGYHMGTVVANHSQIIGFTSIYEQTLPTLQSWAVASQYIVLAASKAEDVQVANGIQRGARYGPGGLVPALIDDASSTVMFVPGLAVGVAEGVGAPGAKEVGKVMGGTKTVATDATRITVTTAMSLSGIPGWSTGSEFNQ